MSEITVQELQKLLNSNTDIQLIDIREDYELEICVLPKSQHILLGEIGQRLNELRKDCNVYIYCRSGGRSGKVVKQLRDAGWTNVFNVKGGTLAWSDHIDPTMLKY